MTKNIIISAIAILTLNFGFAQTFQTQVGPSFKKESEKDIYHIVFPSAYGFMTLHHLDNVMMDNTKAMVLTKYDQTMQSIETKTFNLPKLGQRAADLQRVIELDDKLIFLSTSMDKKTGAHQVFAQVYNQKDNSVSAEKVLASIPIEGYSNSGYYQIAVSPNQSKIAIYANMPFEKKMQEKVQAWMYDIELNNLWEHTETLSFESERAYQEETFVSNEGQLYVSKVTDFYKKTRTTHLLKCNGKSFESSVLSADGFQPMDMSLINVTGKPMLVGFFWDGTKGIIKVNSEEGNDNDGAFLYDLSESKLIGIHKWSTSLNTSDLKSLEVVDVKVVGDDIFMIGEKRLEKSEFRKNGSTPTMDLDYFYTFGSSVIVNLDTKGTLKSFTPLMGSKLYKNTDKEKGSVAALYLENGLRIFSNNDYIRCDSFFTQNKATFNSPSVRPNGIGTTPYIIPATVSEVKKYNLVYYITNYGDQYWLNKMSW